MDKNKKPLTLKQLKEEIDQLKKTSITLIKATNNNTDIISSIITSLPSFKKVENAIQNYENPEFYIGHLLRGLCYTTSDYEGLLYELNCISNVNPGAAFSIILMSVAKVLDERYSDHIKDSNEIYVVSTIDGKIYKQDKSRIKNYNNFAAFRSVEDATFAIKMVGKIKQFLKNVQKNGK